MVDILDLSTHFVNMETMNSRQTFGHRLWQARTMAGLSLRELSQQIGKAVSHAALAKYEKGDMMPDSALLVRLSRVLGQSPDFFLRPPTLELGNVRFRKMARLSPTLEKAVQEQAVDYFERYAEIIETLGLSHPFKSPLGTSVVRTANDAEDQARELREAWKLGNDPLPSVIAMLESQGIMIHEVDTTDKHIDGLCAVTKAGPVIVLASWLSENPLRKRMTTIHELAHLLLKFPGAVESKVEEKLVARFAGAFLLPADSFRDQFGKHRSVITLEELIQLKVFYGASIMSIMMRARDLDLISEATHRKFWMECGCKWRQQHKEPGDEKFQINEAPVRFKMLVLRAAAEGVISFSKGAGLLKMPLGRIREELQQVCT